MIIQIHFKTLVLCLVKTLHSSLVEKNTTILTVTASYFKECHMSQNNLIRVIAIHARNNWKSVVNCFKSYKYCTTVSFVVMRAALSVCKELDFSTSHNYNHITDSLDLFRFLKKGKEVRFVDFVWECFK